MRKTYVMPAVVTLAVELQQMVAASGDNKPMNFDGNGDSGSGKLVDETATGDGLSRRRSLWDEEE